MEVPAGWCLAPFALRYYIKDFHFLALCETKEDMNGSSSSGSLRMFPRRCWQSTWVKI